MTGPRPLRALLVDPSLFTGPYDAALTEGLLAAGVEPSWATRPTRRGDLDEIAPQYVDAFFYKRVDQAEVVPGVLRPLVKGLAHAVGLSKLVWRVAVQKPDVVHFQWTVVPVLDAAAIAIIRCFRPVVLTVHDTVPFNGDRHLRWQSLGARLPISLANRLIVHTKGGQAQLCRDGIPAEKIAVIPHGPLKLRARSGSRQDRSRYTFVLFGELKPYKGLDLLVEAVARLPETTRKGARFIVAGRPRMDLQPIRARIAALGLDESIQIRAERLSDEAMADLFAQTDCFLFPYRQIDASGVYFLTKSLGKWMIASRVGIFAEEIEDGAQGALVQPEDPAALAEAIARAVAEQPIPAPRPSADSWAAIGHATSDLYGAAIAS